MDHTSTVVVSTGTGVELLAIVTLLAIVAFVWIARKAIKQYKREVDVYEEDTADNQRHRRVIEQQSGSHVDGQLSHWSREQQHWDVQEQHWGNQAQYWEHQNQLADYLREHAFKQLRELAYQRQQQLPPEIKIAWTAPNGNVIEAPTTALPRREEVKLLSAASHAIIKQDTREYEALVLKAREHLDKHWGNSPPQLPSGRR